MKGLLPNTTVLVAEDDPDDAFLLYLVKPSSLERLAEMMKLTFDFWAMCAVPALPRKVA